MTIRAVIVDDDKTESGIVRADLEKWAQESGNMLECKVYHDAVLFLESYDAKADIIFLDVEMPQMDGIRAAKILRKHDKQVILIFVTNFAQYAIKGYEVDAFDYVLKPVSYTAFRMTLERAVNILEHRRNDHTVNLMTKEGITRLAVSEIAYVEVADHDVIIHMTNGEELRFRSTLSYFAELLKERHFVLCNACYLVNLRYVRKVDKDSCFVCGHRLQISQAKRKLFLREVAKYFGGSV